MDNFRQVARAAAKHNGDFICIDTYSGYRLAILDPRGKQHLLRPDVDDSSLGKSILDSLSLSRFAIPQDDLDLNDNDLIAERYSEWVKNLKDVYNYSNDNELFDNMLHCSIESRDGSLKFSPSRHEELEGWSGDGIKEEDHVVIPANSAPSVVGAALRLALSHCS